MILNYFFHLFIMVCVYAILSMSMNLSVGFTGMVNLAHVGFWAIGAYTSAILALQFGIPFWAGLLAGSLLASLFGYLLAYPTVRLKGDYLVVGTLGFGIIVEAVLYNWTSVTRGPLGLPGIPRPELFGITFNTLQTYALLSATLAVSTYIILSLVVSSPFGRVLQAIRDDEIAAKTLGKDTFTAKAKSLALAAFFAGSAGSLYAHYITFIDPVSFSMTSVILVLSMVLIGGTGSLVGSVAGAILLVLLPEPLRFLDLPNSLLGGLRQATYAILLILVILKRPQGLLGENTVRAVWKSVQRRIRT